MKVVFGGDRRAMLRLSGLGKKGHDEHKNGRPA
jgi:hypothetical protein